MVKSTPKQKLWKAFAEWIKLRDSPNGYASCISCGKVMSYPNSDGAVHAGHLYPRSVTFNALWFHEKNVSAQCSFCNTHLEGNSMEYRKGLVKRYGEGVIEELEQARAAGQGQKMYPHDYDELAKYYRKESRAMKKARGIVY